MALTVRSIQAGPLEVESDERCACWGKQATCPETGVPSVPVAQGTADHTTQQCMDLLGFPLLLRKSGMRTMDKRRRGRVIAFLSSIPEASGVQSSSRWTITLELKNKKSGVHLTRSRAAKQYTLDFI